MMFQLFKGYLKTAVDTPEEHQTRIRFEIYVLGMSLQRLEDKIQEPKWKGREVGTQEMQDFLKSSYSCVDVPKFQMTSTEKDEFKSFLAFGKLEIDPETEKDIEKCAFTDNVASLFHDLLKQLFTNATDRLRALKKYPIRGKMKEGNTSQELDVFKKQQEGFGKDLKKLWFNLLVLNGCNNVCKRLMQAYLGAIKNVTRPPTPSNSRNNDNNDDEIDNDEDDEDDEDDEGNRSLTWTTAYHAWIRRMVRQTNAAGALTSLNAQWKMRLSKIDFDIVEEQAPDTTMEAWETTIKTICTNSKNPSLAKEVIKALRTIASGNTPGQDKVYAPLKGRNKWEKAFRGSIHCEAMIASRDLVRGVQGVSRYGILRLQVLMIDSVRSSAFPNVVASSVLFLLRDWSAICGAQKSFPA